MSKLTDEQLNEIFRYSFSLIDSRMTPNQQAFTRAVEAEACVKRDARIEHLERVLVQAREALHSCVPGDYSTGHVIYPSFDNDAVDASIAAIDEAIKEKT